LGWLTETKADERKATIQIAPFGDTKSNLEGTLYPDSSYGTYASLAFGRNELAYSCIMFKARTLPQGVLRVYTPNQVEPLDDHRLRRLIEQPNPTTDETAFLMLSIVYLDLSGNSFWLIVRDKENRPTELWPLRPDLVRIVPNPRNARQWHYGYVPNPGGVPQAIDAIPVAFNDIIHIKYPNPLDQYFGQAPMRPATRAVSVDNARTDFVDTLLRNDAVPRTIITTQSEIDEQVVDRLERRWFRRFSGANRGKPAFLQQGMDVKVLGLNLDELQFGDMSGVTEARICMTFGVHPILIGAKVGLDRSTFSNYREAKAAFWEDEGMNLQAMFAGGVRSQLVPEFTGVGRQPIGVRHDNSAVLALQEAESSKWERATNALARGGITINDFRATVGLDPVRGGDVFLIGAGVTVTPANQIGKPVSTETAPNNQVDQQQAEQPPQLQAASYADQFLGNGRKADV